MPIHTPGLPGNIPPADVLWARWALLAAIDATTEAEASTYRTGMWVDHDGLHYEDGGCTWWAMSRVGEGRFVLYGEDESSGVKWHKPPIDMLAGGPDWLPFDELRERIGAYELGCVYWFEDGVWARAPYPEDLRDDGLSCGMSLFIEREQVLDELSSRLLESAGRLGAEGILSDAETRSLTPDRLVDVLRPETPGDEPPDRPAIVRVLLLAGIAVPTAQ